MNHLRDVLPIDSRPNVVIGLYVSLGLCCMVIDVSRSQRGRLVCPHAQSSASTADDDDNTLSNAMDCSTIVLTVLHFHSI